MQRGSQLWHQDREGIGGTAEPRDYFGVTLGAGNPGRGGAADLVIGASGESTGFSTPGDADKKHIGAVNVLYGSGSALRVAGNRT